jgi:hypothetical protein
MESVCAAVLRNFRGLRDYRMNILVGVQTSIEHFRRKHSRITNP